MSAAKMVADSTQSELADAMDGKKRKKKVKKGGKKVMLPEDEDSDLDLKKELKPISAYIKDRPAMVEQMFHSVHGASLQRALPELLKSIPLDELKLLCLEQLEVMSKKRIRRILAGEDSANISSSGTEDETSDEGQPGQDGVSQQMESQVDGHPADSTFVQQENIRNTLEENIQDWSQVKVKQEPLDSGDDGEEENEEERAEPADTYTSGSEDGELVKRDDQNENYPDTMIKQEPMSEGEPEEDTEEDLIASMQAGSEDGVLPSIMMDQMELLELEMRARAIKAMLSSHDGAGNHPDDENDNENMFDESAENDPDVGDTNNNDEDYTDTGHP